MKFNITAPDIDGFTVRAASMDQAIRKARKHLEKNIMVEWFGHGQILAVTPENTRRFNPDLPVITVN